jgi:uncharacterized membrane protein
MTLSYSARVRGEIRRWTEGGLIDPETAAALTRDVESRSTGSPNFGRVLATMAALLLGAAVLIFVAANWEAIPRLARVVALFSLIGASYIGGSVLKLRGHGAFGEGAWLIGAAAFGASISLIGQMYHLSGDAAGAVLVWCAGTALAAAMLRSGPLSVASVVLAATWMLTDASASVRPEEFPGWSLSIVAPLWLVSYWTASAASRHLLLLTAILYGVLMAFTHSVVTGAILLAAASAALFALAILRPDQSERVARIGGLLPLYCLAGFLTGLGMVQLDLADGHARGFAAAASAALAGIAAALVLAGRGSRGVRWAAYAGFATELCLVYWAMVGTMLGTAGFFFAAALVLGAFAIAISHIEVRAMSIPTRERSQ